VTGTAATPQLTGVRSSVLVLESASLCNTSVAIATTHVAERHSQGKPLQPACQRRTPGKPLPSGGGGTHEEDGAGPYAQRIG
jgi:hypothetical protein